MRRATLAAVSLLAGLAACTPKVESDAELVARAGAPLFKGMEAFHRTIDTKDPGHSAISIRA